MAVKTERADYREVAPTSRQAAAAAASETSRCRAWTVGEHSAKAPTTRPMGRGEGTRAGESGAAGHRGPE
eukprot:5484658-Prymnesium_polylepis.1